MYEWAKCCIDGDYLIHNSLALACPNQVVLRLAG